MFDVGIGEVGLIAVIALLVLGPERLPGAARTAGALLRKVRQSWQTVRTDIERELAAEELKRSIEQTTAAVDPTTHLQGMAKNMREMASASSSDMPTTPAASHDEQD